MTKLSAIQQAKQTGTAAEAAPPPAAVIPPPAPDPKAGPSAIELSGYLASGE